MNSPLTSRPEPKGEPTRPVPFPFAQKVGSKAAEWLTEALVFAAATALVGAIMMLGFGIMHEEFAPVPALSFYFCWSFTWTLTTLSIWFYTATTRGD